MKRVCVVCNEVIPQGRIDILPQTRFCVKHSSVKGYRAITTLNGEKDHTWNDIELLSEEEFQELNRYKNGKG